MTGNESFGFDDWLDSFMDVFIYGSRRGVFGARADLDTPPLEFPDRFINVPSVDRVDGAVHNKNLGWYSGLRV